MTRKRTQHIPFQMPDERRRTGHKKKKAKKPKCKPRRKTKGKKGYASKKKSPALTSPYPSFNTKMGAWKPASLGAWNRSFGFQHSWY